MCSMTSYLITISLSALLSTMVSMVDHHYYRHLALEALIKKTIDEYVWESLERYARYYYCAHEEKASATVRLTYPVTAQIDYLVTGDLVTCTIRSAERQLEIDLYQAGKGRYVPNSKGPEAATKLIIWRVYQRHR